MNRFDRVTSILLLLQTRSVLTARFLSDHFGVTERTIYRDIGTLENTGVPIGAEAGVGYFLEKGYRLPPVSFILDEAASFKDYLSSLDADLEVLPTGSHFPIDDVNQHDQSQTACSVPDQASVDEQGHLKAQGVPHSGDHWLRECRGALGQHIQTLLT